MYASLFRTIREVFPQTAGFSTDPTDPDATQSILLLATNGQPLPEDALHAFESSRVRDVPTGGLLLTDDYAPTDYIFRELIRESFPRDGSYSRPVVGYRLGIRPTASNTEVNLRF